MSKRAGRWDELYASGTVEDAIRYGELFWPTFTESEGMVLLLEEAQAQPDLQDIQGTLRRFEGDRTEMERQFNLIEVPTLFASGVDASDEALRQLAEALRASWQAKLDRDFPGRRFTVEVLEGELDDPSIRFFTQR